MDRPHAVPRTRFGLWVSATPAELILLAEDLDARLTDHGTLNAFCDVSEDAERVRIQFGVPEPREYIEGQGVNDFGWITARAEGGGSRIWVQYWDEDAQANPAQRWWELYREEMEREGWEIVTRDAAPFNDAIIERAERKIAQMRAQGQLRAGTGARRLNVLKLHLLEDASQREIAAELRVSLDTVKDDMRWLRINDILR